VFAFCNGLLEAAPMQLLPSSHEAQANVSKREFGLWDLFGRCKICTGDKFMEIGTLGLLSLSVLIAGEPQVG
ncbi:E3 ubiquitinprotein ligase RNF170like, partial [Caligus rogercresseyi]